MRHRFWLGFALAWGGFELMLEHYVRYGGLLHLTPDDHGLVGLVLIVLGALLAGLRPGGAGPNRAVRF